MKVGKSTLTVLVGNSSLFALKGYEKGSMEVQGKEMTVYLPENGEADHALLAFGNENGERIVYLYDPLDETLQRYRFDSADGSLATMSEEYHILEEKSKLMNEENVALRSEKQALLEELASFDGVKKEYDAAADRLAALEAEMDTLAIQYNQETIVMYATVGICGVLAVLLIILLVKRKK